MPRGRPAHLTGVSPASERERRRRVARDKKRAARLALGPLDPFESALLAAVRRAREEDPEIARLAHISSSWSLILRLSDESGRHLPDLLVAEKVLGVPVSRDGEEIKEQWPAKDEKC